MSKFPNPWHPEDPVRFSVVKRQWILDFPWDQVDSKTQTLLQNGRLQMKCVHCETESIAGPWCWKCGRMSDPKNWYVSRAVAEDGTRRRGRPTKAEMASAIRYCEVC